MKPMKSSVKVVLSVVFGFVYPIILLFLTGLFEFLVQSDSFSWYFEILLGTAVPILFLILENHKPTACPCLQHRIFYSCCGGVRFCAALSYKLLCGKLLLCLKQMGRLVQRASMGIISYHPLHTGGSAPYSKACYCLCEKNGKGACCAEREERRRTGAAGTTATAVNPRLLPLRQVENLIIAYAEDLLYKNNLVGV